MYTSYHMGILTQKRESTQGMHGRWRIMGYRENDESGRSVILQAREKTLDWFIQYQPVNSYCLHKLVTEHRQYDVKRS